MQLELFNTPPRNDDQMSDTEDNNDEDFNMDDVEEVNLNHI